jgi:hypothetical protein
MGRPLHSTMGSAQIDVLISNSSSAEQSSFTVRRQVRKGTSIRAGSSATTEAQADQNVAVRGRDESLATAKDHQIRGRRLEFPWLRFGAIVRI